MTASTTIPSGDVSGLGTIATQNANAVAITGGTVNGTTIGATTASTGAFTYLSTSGSTSTTPTLSFNGSNSPIASGATIPNSYLQFILQNKSGTAGASTNYVLSNDLGTDSSYYGEFGMNSSVYSASTPADFFSLNNGIYFSGHDGDLTIGSGNGYKTYLAWGTTGQSAHVINATGAIGLNTNITGSTNFGTSGQVLTSAGSSATPTWATPTTGTVTSITAGTGLSGGTITSTGTIAIDSTVATLTGSQTLTNKTLTSPTVNTPVVTGGTIDNTVIGGTTPAAGTFTTITGQTEVLKGTGQNLFLYSNTFSNAYWTITPSYTTGITDPFGGTTATQIPFSAQFQGVIGIPSNNNFSGLTYTVSIWVQVASGTRTFSITTNTGVVLGSYTATTTWTRYSTNFVIPSGVASINIVQDRNATGFVNTNIYGAQIEIGSVTGAYIATTSTAVYGTPSLSFSGVAGVGLQSDGALYVSPAGTGALQAQKTDSTATGGNVRGTNAVDWQTVRTGAAQVASGVGSVITGGQLNTSNGYSAVVSGGYANTSNSAESFVGAGSNNSIGSNGQFSAIVGGAYNTANGYYNFIGAGYTNSGTASAAATTNTTTIVVSASTTIYLSSTNANIKVGQYISGTGITANTYATSTVTTGTAAVMNTSTISGTTLTVGSLASGTIIAGMVLTGTGVTAGTYIVSGAGSSWTVSTSQTVASTTITGTAYTFTISQAATTTAGITLSFYTPHGVVVGGGNNQATGSYSFIGGGGDAGTAANRNSVAGDWGAVVGGNINTLNSASSYSFIGGGQQNSITNTTSVLVGGNKNTVSGYSSFIGGGYFNTSNGNGSVIVGGQGGTNRSIAGANNFASNYNTRQGDAQTGLYVLSKAATTDATATVLTTNFAAAGTTNQVILPNDSAYYFQGYVISTAQFNLATTAAASAAGTATITFATQTVAPFVVGQTIVVAGITPTVFNGTWTVTACTTTTVQFALAGTNGPQTVAGTVTATSLTKGWNIEGAIMRTSAVGGTRLIGSPTVTSSFGDTGTSGWSIAVAADTTNGGLKVTFTGAAATTIRTVAQIQTTEVTY